jgi:hypothetical protein
MAITLRVSIFIISTILLLGCDSLPLEENEAEYPLIIEKIPFTQLEQLNNQYYENNNGQICSTLNEFGLTGFSRVLFPDNVNPCVNRQLLREELLYSDNLLDQVKHQLQRNAIYTGVYHPEQLVLDNVISLDGCTICEGPDINNVPLQWKFTFQPQKVNGLEVSGTDIVVYIDRDGVNRIWGNWFEVVDPGFVEFGSNNAKEKLVGMSLYYSTDKNQIFEQEVGREEILDEAKLKFSPIETEKGLEIHKVWVIDVLQENTSHIKWNVFISTVTGEILATEVL